MRTFIRDIHPNKKGPTFFVVGAPKAGTTSLYFYLNQHPEIYLPKVKEPHFFSCPEVLESYYQVRFITKEADYFALYSNHKHETVAGDMSPSYLSYPMVAERIKRFSQKAQIIIVLRDPVSRAISHFLMDVRKGYQKQKLSQFLKKPEESPLFYKEYIENGFYYEQVKQYYQTFPKEQILILLFDELINDPLRFVKTIFKFLKIDSDFTPDMKEIHNTSLTPRIKALKVFMGDTFVNNKAKQLLEALPDRATSFIKKKLFKEDKKALYLFEKNHLLDFYRQDILKLARLIEMDLSHWLNP